MKIENEDGSATDAVGFLDLGTMAIPRSELARVLPDIDRFESYLELTLRVDKYMGENSGAIPPWLRPSQADGVMATMRDLAALDEAACVTLRAELSKGATK